MKVENQLLISGWLPSVLGRGWYIHQVLRNRKIANPQIWLLFHVDTKSLIYYYILFESSFSLISLTWFMNLLRCSNSQPTPFCSSRCDRCSGFYCSKHKGKAVIPAKFRAFRGLAIAMGWQEHLQTWTQPWILNKFDENWWKLFIFNWSFTVSMLIIDRIAQPTLPTELRMIWPLQTWQLRVHGPTNSMPGAQLWSHERDHQG